MTMNLPKASSLGQYFLAMASLITATSGEPPVSRSVTPRPRSRGTCKVRK